MDAFRPSLLLAPRTVRFLWPDSKMESGRQNCATYLQRLIEDGGQQIFFLGRLTSWPTLRSGKAVTTRIQALMGVRGSRAYGGLGKNADGGNRIQLLRAYSTMDKTRIAGFREQCECS